jgi:hypothetical protein
LEDLNQHVVVTPAEVVADNKVVLNMKIEEGDVAYINAISASKEIRPSQLWKF